VAEGISIAERGRGESGPVESNERLFMQLLVFDAGPDVDEAVLTGALQQADMHGVLYADVLHARRVGLLTWARDPAWFVADLRPFLNAAPFGDLALQPAYTMTGRTYAIGYESDLEEVLLRRPVRHATTEAWPWAVWYPLRRKGTFVTEPAEEQRRMLMEHGGIGMAYGRADHAHDIRLACHGLDANDNDFVVALVGRELAPLSKVVEHMRKTKQTSEYMDHMGPFFVGHAVWQQPASRGAADQDAAGQDAAGQDAAGQGAAGQGAASNAPR